MDKKLNAPKGLTIVPSKNPDESDKLFIADVDELVEVDIDTAKIVNKYKASGSVCMNDVTHDKYGNVYVGDTYTDSIYRLNSFWPNTTLVLQSRSRSKWNTY